MALIKLRKAPTYQNFTASGTYTPSAGCIQAEVDLWSGGGGGSGATHNGGSVAGANAGDCSFATTTAKGGSGGGSGTSSIGGAGGTGGADGAASTIIERIDGMGGSSGYESLTTGFSATPPSTLAGNSAGRAGSKPGTNANIAAAASPANSGAGGIGAVAANGPTNYQCGGSAGGGERVRFTVDNPTGTYAIVIAAAAAGGVSNNNGGAGGTGGCRIKEIYS